MNHARMSESTSPLNRWELEVESFLRLIDLESPRKDAPTGSGPVPKELVEVAVAQLQQILGLLEGQPGARKARILDCIDILGTLSE